MVVSGEISVKSADVEHARDRVRTVAGNIELLLSDLRTMVRPIVAEWTGTAGENYQYQQQLWQTAADDLHAVLLRIAAVLDNSAASYTEAESHLHQLWSNP